jgi:hypothetical protein
MRSHCHSTWPPLLVALLLAMTGASAAPAQQPPARPESDSTWLEPDLDCDFVHTMHHPNPTALVTEFVQRASTGAFDHTEDWMPSAVMCVGHEPGYDGFLVVEAYRVARLDSLPNRVRFVLRRRARGMFYSASDFDRSPGLVVDTLVAQRTPFGWRIVNPEWNWLTVEAARRRGWPVDSVPKRRP